MVGSSGRPLSDYEKIKHLTPAWIRGYFKSEGQNFGRASLEVSHSPFPLPSREGVGGRGDLDALTRLYDWLVVDWDRMPLSWADCLISPLSPDPAAVEEAQKFEASLIQDYYPMERLFWVVEEKTPWLSDWLKGRITCLEEGWIVNLTEKEKEEAPTPPLCITEISYVAEKQALLRQIQSELEKKGLRSDTPHLQEQMGSLITEILATTNLLPPAYDRHRLHQEFLDELLGLGPIETLLKNPEISEIMVNGLKPIFVEKAGKIISTSQQFLDESSLRKAIERILTPIGRRVDESSPTADARLSDGSRVHVVIPPLAIDGPVVTIRRFSKTMLGPEELVRGESANRLMIDYLQAAVRGRKNILVSGGTGSGKTTLLNILSSFIPEDERIITIEDAAELKLQQDHVVRLESRPANIEGKGIVTIRDLVRNALRMRPDRIVVGECRGPESLDMLQAMNTGHNGSLTTLHANTPRDAIRRLETLVLFAGTELPSRAIREQIASAIDLIVQIELLPQGCRKIVAISEITGLEGDQITMQTCFSYDPAKGFCDETL